MVVGSIMVALPCCVICCFAMVAAAKESENKQGGNNYNNLPNERTVANPRGRLLGRQQQPRMTAEQHRIVGGLLSLAVVEECGFCVATENNRRMIVNRLQSVSPLGQTALRDAVIFGIQKMLALKVVIAKLGVIQHKLCCVMIEISVKK